MRAMQDQKRNRWITLGTKILFGVSLISNLFIGTLLYINQQATATVEETVDEVLAIREELSANLRRTIVDLQQEFLGLPAFLKVSQQPALLNALKGEFRSTGATTLAGRESYQRFYSRQERRDLLTNHLVIQTGASEVFVSAGVFDAGGTFTDTVERVTFPSSSPAEDAARMAAKIDSLSASATSTGEIREKIAALSAKVADVSLKAETTRNEILYHVDEISAKERQLAATRDQQRRFTLGMGAAAIFANMLVLFFLVRLIVEKPLHRLTHTIEEIRAGKSPEIPWSDRRDQIGVLSGAISSFREALDELQIENQRKVHEQTIIDELIDTVAAVIHTLDERARELVGMSTVLQNLADTAGDRSGNVSLHASDTAEHTAGVSESAGRLRLMMQEISSQISSQGSVVQKILAGNENSRDSIRQLNQSVREIDSIIRMVQEVAAQTKVLSLNATIEAARSGQAGRGFAVVAEGIRSLSEKTEEATREIMVKVAGIETAGAMLDRSLREIDGGMQDLRQVSANISQTVIEQEIVTGNIAGLVSQTSDNTRTVSENIAEVNIAAAKTSDLSRQVHEHASEIAARLTDLLHETTARLQQLGRGNNPGDCRIGCLVGQSVAHP
jgi:methyl-accepting chemotaxis protein